MVSQCGSGVVGKLYYRNTNCILVWLGFGLVLAWFWLGSGLFRLGFGMGLACLWQGFGLDSTWFWPSSGLVLAWLWPGFEMVLARFWLGYGSFSPVGLFLSVFFGFGLVKAWFWSVFSSLETKHNLFYYELRLYAPTSLFTSVCAYNILKH